MVKAIFQTGAAEKIIIAINKSTYMTRISRRTKIVYSHATRVIKKLEDKNIVTITKQGRRSFAELTEKGKKIRELLIELQKEIHQ